MRTLSIVLLLSIGLVGSAHAAVTDLEATLDQSQQVPPSGSSGTGSATLTYDDVTGELTWNITWGGLTGPAMAMHFHGPAPPGINAGVQVNIGAISGLVSPSIGSAFITPAQAADLLADLWYINVHTAQFPGGEIRGQVVPVALPVEDSTWGSVKALYQ
jgi:hypothetical protein